MSDQQIPPAPDAAPLVGQPLSAREVIAAICARIDASLIADTITGMLNATRLENGREVPDSRARALGVARARDWIRLQARARLVDADPS